MARLRKSLDAAREMSDQINLLGKLKRTPSWQRKRLKAVRLGLKEELSLPEIAKKVGVSSFTISHWFDLFRSEGLTGLLRRKGGRGPTSFLSPSVKADLQRRFESAGFDGLDQVEAWLKQRLGRDVSRKSVYRYLKQVHEAITADSSADKNVRQTPKTRQSVSDPTAPVRWPKLPVLPSVYCSSCQPKAFLDGTPSRAAERSLQKKAELVLHALVNDLRTDELAKRSCGPADAQAAYSIYRQAIATDMVRRANVCAKVLSRSIQEALRNGAAAIPARVKEQIAMGIIRILDTYEMYPLRLMWKQPGSSDSPGLAPDSRREDLIKNCRLIRNQVRKWHLGRLQSLADALKLAQAIEAEWVTFREPRRTKEDESGEEAARFFILFRESWSLHWGFFAVPLSQLQEATLFCRLPTRVRLVPFHLNRQSGMSGVDMFLATKPLEGDATVDGAEVNPLLEFVHNRLGGLGAIGWESFPLYFAESVFRFTQQSAPALEASIRALLPLCDCRKEAAARSNATLAATQDALEGARRGSTDEAPVSLPPQPPPAWTGRFGDFDRCWLASARVVSACEQEWTTYYSKVETKYRRAKRGGQKPAVLKPEVRAKFLELTEELGYDFNQDDLAKYELLSHEFRQRATRYVDKARETGLPDDFLHDVVRRATIALLHPVAWALRLNPDGKPKDILKAAWRVYSLWDKAPGKVYRDQVARMRRALRESVGSYISLFVQVELCQGLHLNPYGIADDALPQFVGKFVTAAGNHETLSDVLCETMISIGGPTSVPLSIPLWDYLSNACAQSVDGRAPKGSLLVNPIKNGVVQLNPVRGCQPQARQAVASYLRQEGPCGARIKMVDLCLPGPETDPLKRIRTRSAPATSFSA